MMMRPAVLTEFVSPHACQGEQAARASARRGEVAADGAGSFLDELSTAASQAQEAEPSAPENGAADAGTVDGAPVQATAAPAPVPAAASTPALGPGSVSAPVAASTPESGSGGATVVKPQNETPRPETPRPEPSRPEIPRPGPATQSKGAVETASVPPAKGTASGSSPGEDVPAPKAEKTAEGVQRDGMQPAVQTAKDAKPVPLKPGTAQARAAQPPADASPKEAEALTRAAVSKEGLGELTSPRPGADAQIRPPVADGTAKAAPAGTETVAPQRAGDGRADGQQGRQHQQGDPPRDGAPREPAPSTEPAPRVEGAARENRFSVAEAGSSRPQGPGPGAASAPAETPSQATPSAASQAPSAATATAAAASPQAAANAPSAAQATAAGAGASAPSAAAVDQVVSRLTALHSGQSATVALDPPELGRVLVRFFKRGKGWQVQLIAENREVAQALTRDIGRLNQALGQDGDAIDVEVFSGGNRDDGDARRDVDGGEPASPPTVVASAWKKTPQPAPAAGDALSGNTEALPGRLDVRG